jgi:hypothetical protein
MYITEISIKKIKHTAQPARGVVDSFGGCRALAAILKLNPGTVSRWTTSAAFKGTGGKIPQKYWGALIVAAQDKGFTLTVFDLSGM